MKDIPMKEEPQIRVGILSGSRIDFYLPDYYQVTGTYSRGVVTVVRMVKGEQTVRCVGGKMEWEGRKEWESLYFVPVTEEEAFELKDVTIGVDFHWERKENQRFQGALTFVAEGDKLTAINVIKVEDYLTSVISSEMSATASLELLKAHAVISRSWLLSLSSPSSLSPDPSPVGRGGCAVKVGDSSCYQTADKMIYGLLKEKQQDLKENPTEAEKIVWEGLRNNRLNVKFRRQHIIDDYIVDFVALQERLIIEIDGGYHNTPEQQIKDQDRTAHLEALGYHLLRFTNEEVISQPNIVISKIKAHITAPKDAAPSQSAAPQSIAQPPSAAQPQSAAQPPLPTGEGSGERLLIWYGRSSHTHFDVCADDHCQRYQGITRASTEIVKQAIEATRGQVLTSDGKICDARYSKCCGGAFEEFQYCWEDTPHSYLKKQRDLRIANAKADGLGTGATRPSDDLRFETTCPADDLPDLTQEAEAARWIRSTPPAYCNTTDKRILSQVLNNYDQETTDFYRWRVEYTQQELAALILKRSGVDYGAIIDLVPIARGTSGRLWKLKIAGTKQTLVIGKELEIRRTLSASHLYSSAFVVEKEGSVLVGDITVPARFILRGAGWGHGVGLCQIGAAMMGEQGYLYDAILKHYYIGASIDKLY